MEIQAVFLTEAGGEVRLKTDGENFSMTRRDFETFASHYLNPRLTDCLINGGAETYLPLALSPEGEEQLTFLDEKLRAMRYALYLLGICDKSRRQLAFQLKKKGYAAPAAEEALDILEKNGYLSDERFCRRKCELLAQGKLFGRRRILSELLTKGLPMSLCEKVLEESDIDFEENLRTLCGKLIKEPIESREQMRKWIVKLTRYGYSYDEIRGALEDYTGNGEWE